MLQYFYWKTIQNPMKIQTSLLLFLVFCQTLAQPSGSCCQNGNIIVSGEGKASAQPDVGIVSISFEEKALTSAQAVKALSSKVNQALAIIQANGISATDYQTGSLNVFPEYNYRDGKNEVVGQKASQSFTVKVRNLDQKGQKVAKLIDALAQVNNLRINSVSFDIFDKEPLQVKAREQAFRDAKNKAEDFAEAAGVKVGRVVTVDDYERVQAPARNYGGAELKMASFADAATTSVPVGEQDVSYRTTVTFLMQ